MRTKENVDDEHDEDGEDDESTKDDDKGGTTPAKTSQACMMDKRMVMRLTMTMK